MSSILTNNGAMVALQTLKSINADLTKTQSMISTGKAVASARDNSAVWAISKVMEADVKGFKGISDSLALGQSTVAVARKASERRPTSACKSHATPSNDCASTSGFLWRSSNRHSRSLWYAMRRTGSTSY